jgi:glycosyltransferase involved in cell wall biosynthesis
VYGVLFWGYSLALPLAALVAPTAKRVAGRRSLPDTDRPGQSWAFGLRRLADRLSHAVVANSGAVAAAWIETNSRLRDRMHVVENGVQLGPPGRSRPPDAPVTIVCVASLVGYKGHETLLDALSSLGDTRAPWRVWLIGSGPDEASLRERIAASALGGRVELLGRQDDVGSWLEDADAAVLASYSEGLPNAVLEPMAYGLPVAATDVGGVSDLLADGAGLVVPPADAPALAAALRRLIEDPELRASLGAAGRDRVAGRFGIDAMRDRTLSVFRSL